MMTQALVKPQFVWYAPIESHEKLLDKPLRITGVAIHAGMTRNWNLYVERELKAAAPTLVGKPIYLEHVAADKAIGRVTKAWWDDEIKGIRYEGEIYDEEIAEKIRKGLIQHVSIAADYQRLDDVDGVRVPRGLRFMELSLVAVPGDPRANVEVLERLVEKLTPKEEDKAVSVEGPMAKITVCSDDSNTVIREQRIRGETCYLCGRPVSDYVLLADKKVHPGCAKRFWDIALQMFHFQEALEAPSEAPSEPTKEASEEASKEQPSEVHKEVHEEASEEAHEELHERVVRFEATPTAPMDRAWDEEEARHRLRIWASRDGSGRKETIDWAKYRRGFAWYDPEHADDFMGYKLPHHTVNRQGRLVVVWKGVVAAMAALKGARGGVQIPEEDRRGVYNHLAGHYRQFNREPPPLEKLMEALEKGAKLCIICGHPITEPPLIEFDDGEAAHLTCLREHGQAPVEGGETERPRDEGAPQGSEAGAPEESETEPAGEMEGGENKMGEKVVEAPVEEPEPEDVEAYKETKKVEEAVKVPERSPEDERKEHLERVAEKLRETITSTDAAAAIPDIWAPDISRKPAGVVANLRDFVKVYPQIRGKPGDKVKIPTITTPEFVELTEGTAPSEAAYTVEAKEVTLAEYGNLISISYSVLEDISGDIVAAIEDGFVEAARLKEDEVILAKLNVIADDNLAAHLWGGDATGTADIDAADVMAPDLIGKAIKEIMEEGYGVSPGSLLLVLHPKQYQDLILNTQFTNAAAWGSRDVITTGRLTNYMGVDIVVSSKVPVTAKDSVTTGEPAVDVYHAFLFRKDAVALVPKRDLQIETQKDISARLLKLMASHRFGAEVLFPKAVVKISTA